MTPPRQEVDMEFPCRFPIKIFGRANTDFESAVLAILQKHVPNMPDGAISRRASGQGNYHALTAVIDAQSREQLDNIYRDLSACEYVLMAL